MPVVKGEAFNACWLDKSSSLQPNLNTGGDSSRQSGAGGEGGRRIFRFTNIQIWRSWVKSFSLRENKFFPGRIQMRSRELDDCCTYILTLTTLNNVASSRQLLFCDLLLFNCFELPQGWVCPICFCIIGRNLQLNHGHINQQSR